VRDRIWVCKDGRRIPVSALDDDHLQKCIDKIERSRGWRKQYLPRLKLEQDIRRIKTRSQP
jgi:hypothetical protein